MGLTSTAETSSTLFSVISTFSGCGGSSLGYQMAGGKVRLAVEYDEDAVKTYRLNFPDTPIFHGDINNPSVRGFRRQGIESYLPTEISYSSSSYDS